jgi:hypothetical protein
MKKSKMKQKQQMKGLLNDRMKNKMTKETQKQKYSSREST